MKTKYSIVMIADGITYHYHGCDKLGKPQFITGFASFTTTFYWRVYKSRKVAENELAKILIRRRMWWRGSETFKVMEWGKEDEN